VVELVVHFMHQQLVRLEVREVVELEQLVELEVLQVVLEPLVREMLVVLDIIIQDITYLVVVEVVLVQ
jgi:hypothetical protein